MRIYLDVDGVLADFVVGACACLGKPDPYREPLQTSHAGVYRMEAFWGMKGVDFWAPLDAAGADFWAGLPLMPDAGGIYSYFVDLVGLDNVVLLTCCAHHPSAAEGRMRWIQKMFPTCRNYFVGSIFSAKTSVLAPDAVLVDDCDAHVEAYSAAGGAAFLCPRAWNSLWPYRKNSVAFLRDAFQAYDRGR